LWDTRLVEAFENLGSEDGVRVGGKNASLGELIRSLGTKGIRVPAGFATTSAAYWRYLEHNDLVERIRRELAGLEGRDGERLRSVGVAVRSAILSGEVPDEVAEAIRSAYAALSARYGVETADVAVRSSATAEDLPEASFAGQLESYLNIRGEDELLDTCRRCYASLFTDRAISYRQHHGFEHMDVALSVGVQKMVRSDLAGAGVLFTLDTDTGFPNVVMINAAWGLGEAVVQGTVNPDQYSVFKPFLDDPELVPIIGKRLGDKHHKIVYASHDRGAGTPTEDAETSEEERESYVLGDDEILDLARWGRAIEAHYGRPMDVEWAKDGESGDLYVVQARPETVESRREESLLKRYSLEREGDEVVTGLAIGHGAGAGRVRLILDPVDARDFRDGEVLVTDMTDPDWVPIMKRAAAIVTDRGGRTSHAAIVSRELGVPAVVGSGNATQRLADGDAVTVSCISGDEGYVYRGDLGVRVEDLDLSSVPDVHTRVMINVATPAGAMRWWRLPCRGVGLARIEYLVNNVIRIHPLALTCPDQLDDDVRARVEHLTRGYDDKTRYFVDHLARGVATIAAAQHPEPVIVRFSDFKSNEYAGLVGGSGFEPDEANPMLGWRGASRYYSDAFREAFALECEAIAMVRNAMDFRNVIVMIPFCRTPAEADRVLDVMARHGLERGRDDLEVYVMAEIPSNIVEADAFCARFDGFSIGTNDLTQLVLGLDRDSERLSYLFDERETSVQRLIEQLIATAHEHGRPVGICGQAPSDHPDFAEFLVRAGIDSISVNPDSVVRVIEHVAKAERARAGTPRADAG